MFKPLETKNGYAIYEDQSLTIADPGGASESSVLSSALPEGLDLADKKFLVQVEVTETSASNGALDAAVQGSLDGSDYVDLDSSVGLSIDSTGKNSGVAVADLSGQEAPYLKIKVYTDGTDIGDSVDVTVRFAVKN